jgi:hypothetical protein
MEGRMETINSLRARKRELLEQINGLGEMRKGSIVEQYMEAEKQDGTIVRRGPYILYSYKEKGKTVSRRLPDLITATLYRDQISEYRTFEGLCDELTRTSQKICDRLEPPETDETRSRKKKRPRPSRQRSSGRWEK